MGIPEKDQSHLFDRFFRASNAINIQGTGLGLNIIKKYLDIIGGEIGFESKEDEGTTFKVTLKNDI
jgi:signal transduction histidine kinase